MVRRDGRHPRTFAELIAEPSPKFRVFVRLIETGFKCSAAVGRLPGNETVRLLFQLDH